MRKIASNFLYTPGIQFINLSKLKDILVARQREAKKRRESEEVGRMADTKKWLWETIIKVTTAIFNCCREGKNVQTNSDGEMMMEVWRKKSSLGIVTEDFHHKSFLVEILKSMTQEEMMTIREEPDDVIKFYVDAWYPEENPTP